ncbi:MAG: ATP-binding protein [Elainellaceae cyanobacterium]
MSIETQTIQRQVWQLQRHAASLLIYRAVLDDPIGQAFLTVLACLQQENDSSFDCLYAYGQWFSRLAEHRQSWQHYLISQILGADTPFSQQVQHDNLDGLPPALTAAVVHDLRALQALYSCTSQQASRWTQHIAQLDEPPIAWEGSADPNPSANSLQSCPIWQKLEQSEDWGDAVDELAAYHRQVGAGLYAQYRALRWHAGQLVGIAHPDPIRLQDLAGYSHQHQALLQNTQALLAGYPALHVLLYGSRGSGKSSLVKSLVNAFGDRGLRLVEVAKSDLNDLPTIVDHLRPVPQKFIVFVDDLSFEEDDDAYKALKVVLEGSLTARPQNVVVYATSNRRHLIREFFGDRPRPSDSDEIHAWDTVQEKLSFSDRFGLTLTFEPADQSTYLTIVHHLAQQFELSLSEDELTHRALQWATRHNGRSGRTARQFVDFLRSELALSAPE